MIIYKICSHQFYKLKLVMCTFNDVKYEIYQVAVRTYTRRRYTISNWSESKRLGGMKAGTRALACYI